LTASSAAGADNAPREGEQMKHVSLNGIDICRMTAAGPADNAVEYG